MNRTLIKFLASALMCVTAIGGYYAGKWNNDINKKTVKTKPNFIFSNNLSCKLQFSTDKDFHGRQISLIGLDTENPSALFSGTGGTSPLKKIYEDKDLLVLQLVAFASGGVDTFHLNKKTGVFTRISAGSVAGEYVYAEKGACA